MTINILTFDADQRVLGTATFQAKPRLSVSEMGKLYTDNPTPINILYDGFAVGVLLYMPDFHQRFTKNFDNTICVTAGSTLQLNWHGPVLTIHPDYVSPQELPFIATEARQLPAAHKLLTHVFQWALK